MRREFLKGIGRALVVTTFAMLAVPAGGVAPARADSAQIEEITWALPGFPNTLLVAHEWNTYNGAIMSLVQEGLLSFDDKLALAPAVAESWQQVDPVTYKYKLRTGVTFQDGSPLTADDVVYTMKWNMNPDSRSQLSAFYTGVKSIEATGDHEVTVTLEKPKCSSSTRSPTWPASS
jgi:peptide/nickel transport system substrate-binding protein